MIARKRLAPIGEHADESAVGKIRRDLTFGEINQPIPLLTQAVAILRHLNETRQSDYVFPGQAPGKPLSNMAMEMMLSK